MSVNAYQRETTEFQPVTITQNGAAVTSGVQVCITPIGQRPATWAAPATLGALIGVMVTGYASGDYDVWAKITANPETPVIHCGTFRVL